MEKLQLGSGGKHMDEKMARETVCVEIQGLQKAIQGNGGNGFSRQQDPADQVGDSHLSHE